MLELLITNSSGESLLTADSRRQGSGGDWLSGIRTSSTIGMNSSRQRRAVAASLRLNCAMLSAVRSKWVPPLERRAIAEDEGNVQLRLHVFGAAPGEVQVPSSRASTSMPDGRRNGCCGRNYLESVVVAKPPPATTGVPGKSSGKPASPR